MSLNKTLLIGRLGHDPEVRDAAGQRVANFSLATDEGYKDKNNVWVERSEWHKIVAWGKLAEMAQKYLKKGSPVFIEGKLTTRKWKNKNNEDRFTTEIVCQTMRMLDGKNVEEPVTPKAATAQDSGASVISDDDIPF